jgi:glutathione-dependent peroxiredoxin
LIYSFQINIHSVLKINLGVHMFNNLEGQVVPNITFSTRVNNEWSKLTSDELFHGKTIIVFSLPGAFTPTCSSSHLPRYNELAGVFKKNGVDDIVCMSVNDTFVMNAWIKHQESENITVVPDGNGEFTKAMGMLIDKSDIGFGKRSWRYSMLVKSGIIEKMFIEPDLPGDPFEVSDADTMLEYINPNQLKPEAVSLFSKPGCPHCIKAKSLLTNQGLSFEEIELGKNISSVSLRAITGQVTVPQIYIGGKHIGGADDLESYLSTT